MKICEFEEAIKAVERQDYQRAVQIFNQHSGEDWANEPYEWKEENSERVSTFIQKLVKVLPETVDFNKVIYLTQNYQHQLVLLPDAINLAAEAIVNFWNRHQNGDPEELNFYLKLLSQNPDGDRVEQIASQAIGIRW